MNTLNCSPVIFGPHITPHCPAAPWWSLSHVTLANLGWYIAGFMIAGSLAGWLSEWIRDRWEITCGRPRVALRCPGTHARVCLRTEAADWGPARYVVIGWDSEHTGIPWLLVHKTDPEHPACWDEDADAFWAPATDFTPDSIRRFRPHLIRVVLAGRVVLVPWLAKYLPVSAVATGSTP